MKYSSREADATLPPTGRTQLEHKYSSHNPFVEQTERLMGQCIEYKLYDTILQPFLLIKPEHLFLCDNLLFHFTQGILLFVPV